MKEQAKFTSMFTAALFMAALVFGALLPSRALAGPVEEAQATTDALAGAVLAAIGSITAATTDDNITENSEAISLLLPKGKGAYRLLDATGDPLNKLNKPKGRFEAVALDNARNSVTTQEVKGQYLLTVVPLTLTSENQEACARCHSNYEYIVVPDIVGAASFRIKLPK